jgi:carbamoyl-phosphate synthase large subunit
MTAYRAQIATPLNVLVTSLSKKVPLVLEVRKALGKLNADGKIHGADHDPDCLGRYFVDAFWKMPLTHELAPEEVIGYCTENDIKAIIPTRDGELYFFSENNEEFQKHNISVMVSPTKAVKACLDKMEFFNVLSRNDRLNPINTLCLPDTKHRDRWVVKDRFGAGSEAILLDVTSKDAVEFSRMLENPVFQPFVQGQEYSVDLYIAQNSVPKGCIVRKREIIVNGESQVTTTADRPDIEKACLEAALCLGLIRHNVFQVLVDDQDRIHLLECNCRFGGASTLSIAAGLDSFYWFFLETIGEDLEPLNYKRNSSALRLVRYPTDLIVNLD